MRSPWPLLVALASCGPGPVAPAKASGPEGGGYPGYLVPMGEVAGDFSAQQRVSARYGDRTFSFRVALQKRGDSLKVVGLTPFNTKAFVLEQRGSEVSFQPYIDQPPPFPPRYILQDIHRAFFLAVPGGPFADGEQKAEREGERVVERWQGGALFERRFARLDGQPAGEITVRYEGGYRPGEAPPPVEFSNGWYGYSLQIHTDNFRVVTP